MNIQRQVVTDANYDIGRAGHAITGIVLHTMVGTWQSAQARFSDPSSQVSVHYGVGLDGSIHQWVDEANTAWQAGDYAVNLTTIGIEHEDNGNAQDAVRTPQLYESSSSLVADICARYNIPCDTDHIFLHRDVIDKTRYPGGTACPDALDTSKIISMAQAKLEANMSAVITKEAVVALALATTGRQPSSTQDEKYINQPATQANLDGLITYWSAQSRVAALDKILADTDTSDAQTKLNQIKQIVG